MYNILRLFPALALAFAMLCSGQRLEAQIKPGPSRGTPVAQPQKAIPDDPGSVPPAFKGVIVRSGDKVVLLDTISRTSYQLDDQEKAKDFLNKTVKVSGVLDPSTGTIRVSAIDPV